MQEIDTQQCFDWAGTLTEQLSYHELTHVFIDILNSLPCIDSVSVFEVYGGKTHSKKDNLNKDLLVKQFPLDVTRTEGGQPFAYLLDHLSEQVKTIEHNNGTKELVSAVTNSTGPDRIVVVKGKPKTVAQVFTNLLRLFRNQIVLHDLKERDVLTSLLNRESLSLRLLEVSEHYRKQKSSGRISDKHSFVAVLDIDHFKRINDNFGHLYGDEVLLRFSQLMERKFRYIDYLFRFGGEEFVVVLNNVSDDEGEIILNRFRSEVAAYNFPEVGKVTVSIGATKITDKGDLPSTLLDRADKALYFAKENGRNQSILFEQMQGIEDTSREVEVELF